MTHRLKIASALAALLITSACGEVAQPPELVRMTVQEGGQGLNGTYRSSGFSQSQVRQMVGRVCTSAGFSGFNQTANGDLVSFSAACAAQTRYTNGADVRFEAQDDGTVDFTISSTQNGRPFETGGNFAI
ncbi:hypothetical protein [Tateyamaria sp. SN6-1]|uniref:hypothetical protein n=1 Tax=Tateyamaria sp. SN6-1 TaxID=3092148 RepID=UPI0039F4845C